MKKLLLIALLAVCNISCNNEKNLPKNFDYGRIENSAYVNDYFGLKLPFDSDWKVQNEAQMTNMADSGIEALSGDDKHMKKVLDASSINVAQLFMIFKYEPRTNTVFNPSLLINVENLSQFPNVKTVDDYLVQAKKLMAQTNMNIEYKKEDYDVTLGNHKFVCMEIFNRDYTINQDYYVTLLNGFAVGIISSYENDADKMALKAMLDNLEINKN